MKNHQAALKTSASGFTIPELLITLFILSTAFFSFTTFFVTVDNVASRAQARAIGDTAALSKIQEYENMEFSSIPIGVMASNYEVEDFTSSLDAALFEPRSGKVFVEPLSSDLLKVNVVITYSFSSSTDIQYITYIQESGIGR